MNDLVPIKYDREVLNKKQETIQVEDDFDYARENVYGIIKKGQDPIEEMMAIASASQHPAAYETLTKMLKVQSELAKTLLKLHEQKKEVKTDAPQPQQPHQQITTDKVINQNLFVGTTEEMQDMIEKRKQGN